VLAGLERCARERQVKVVGSADVHDVHRVRGDQRLGAREALLGAELLASGRRAFRRGGRDAGDVRPCKSSRAGVNPTDEARADEAGAKLAGRLRPLGPPLRVNGEGASLHQITTSTCLFRGMNAPHSNPSRTY
jgi:hypothetical protein